VDGIYIKKAHVFLSIGSNQGDREQNLKNAFAHLEKAISGIRISRIYETLPRYIEDQSLFLNCVMEGETGKTPVDLLDFVLSAEKKVGRIRGNIPKFGPRVIDIDILLYDNAVIHNDRLSIPHPGMYERQFVLIPLLELKPDLTDPVSGKKFAGFLDELDDQGVHLY
jgi:2-amino-4-hydroxy-6-hydroxymethyldihydropteridine diphosphokinase